MAERAVASTETGTLADPGRFRAFYADTLPWVYGYFCHRLGADAALAEDLTQETFLAAVAEIRRGVVIAAPRPWILGIARHKWLDHLRRQQRLGWRLVPWEPGLEEATANVLDDDLATRELAVAVLARLPSPQREALVLRHLGGLSVPEVARTPGRSVDAVESLLARGRVAFRRGCREAGHGA